ncbi:FlgD immunoglobulin-like domain containing protein [Spirochaeta africana]|uniref:Outer membrane protein/peptidoglycan-associated (Lipo)protein n=1 Tax=Spirochaeta africana (strain ATCC 700263 / DSM 8902 / Z-7692) TaxID=889378 RepID=H9UGA8_SPIAZ|nr:FlgD immunoglobulin-like domain containing protein [Spirochaeta africana]AFG36551.1 outer membrane protein/peptidoglycan-associated (lipo)protein [Spirochaeta africana DSM 8902]
MKNILTGCTVAVFLLLLPGLTFAGGQQEDAALSIAFEDDARQFISPTGDGVQDTLELSPIAVRGEGQAIRSYELTVYGTTGELDGQAVYRQAELETRERGFFGRVFNVGEVPSLELPSQLVWDGSFLVGDERDGSIVPDGDYLYQLRITDAEGRSFTTPPARVTVDTEAPVIESVEPGFTLFAPTGDGRRDELVITQRGSREYIWRGVFADSDGEPVREFEQINTSSRLVNDQEPPEITWDGSDADGTPVPDGVYSYTLIGLDRAGNRTERQIEEITIDREAEFLALAAEYEVFAPGTGGERDQLPLMPQVFEPEGIERWQLEVRNDEDALVRRLSGEMPLPEQILFDGRGSLSRPEAASPPVLPDGAYTAQLVVLHQDGYQERSDAVSFEIDTTPPQASVEPLRRVFNPEADDERAQLQFSQTSSVEETTWTGRILDRSGTTVRTFEWENQAEDFAWDGLTDDDQQAPDGMYSYRIEATDLAGNTGSTEVSGLRLDTISDGARVYFSPEAISPQEVFEDKIADDAEPAADPDANPDADDSELEDGAAVQVGIEIENRDDIQSWALEFQHLERGETARITGEGSVPESVVWDGRLDDGRIIDGEYLVRFVLQYPDQVEVAPTAEDYLIVDTRGPELTLEVSPEEFSPDPDMEDTEITVSLLVSDRWSDVEYWSVEILDPQGNRFQYWEGSGDAEETIVWDARDENGELVLSAVEYVVILRARDSLGNESMQTRAISTDVMVIRDGDILRINIPSIVFEPFADDLFERENRTLLENIRILQRLSDILKSYPDHAVQIGGHAVSILYYDEDLARREQEQTLLPLSRRRAREVRKALGILGVELERMTARGFGGAEPVVPHSDTENRWKNRRVEVIMTPNQ